MYRIHDVIKMFKNIGFSIKQQKGSHITMTKSGMQRPLILVKHSQSTIVSNVMLKKYCKQCNIDINDVLNKR